MRLLVTTDFSENSKGAVRFAQTLAKQSKSVEVTFYHAIQIMKPTQWSDVFFKEYKDAEIARLTEDLKKFIYSTLGRGKGKFAKMKFIIDHSSSTEKDIITFAEKHKINFICIATKGAGMLRKVMGTHTSYIVKNSTIPLLVIPSHYIQKPLEKATYLSDFENLKKEVVKISKFSNEISMQFEVLHYASAIIDTKKFEKNKELFKTELFANIELKIQKNNYERSLIEKVTNHVQKTKPELLILFTKREKGFFERLFLPSKSVELTYTTKVPILIYSK